MLKILPPRIRLIREIRGKRILPQRTLRGHKAERKKSIKF